MREYLSTVSCYTVIDQFLRQTLGIAEYSWLIVLHVVGMKITLNNSGTITVRTIYTSRNYLYEHMEYWIKEFGRLIQVFEQPLYKKTREICEKRTIGTVKRKRKSGIKNITKINNRTLRSIQTLYSCMRKKHRANKKLQVKKTEVSNVEI